MKEVKIIVIAAIVTIAIMVSCAYAMPAYAEQGRKEFYPRLTVVVEKEQIGESGLWVITCRDKNSNLWAFYDDIGDWNIGDIINLLMKSINENEEDDKIIETIREGYTENVEEFFHVTGWR